MKKTFTLFAASLFAVGAMAQTEEALFFCNGNPAWNQASVPTTPKATDLPISFRTQYAQYSIIGASNSISKADYTGIKAEYELGKDNNVIVQFQIMGNDWIHFKKEDGGVTTASFAKQNEETINRVEIQSAAAGIGDVIIKAVYLIKADGTEEKMTAFDGTNNAVFPAGDLTFNAAGSTTQLVTFAGSELTFDPEKDGEMTITVELEENSPIDVIARPLKDKGTKNQWGQVEYEKITDDIVALKGSKQLVFKVNATNCPELAGRFELVAGGEDGFPATLKIKSVKLSTSNGTPISDIQIDQVEDGQLYNLMGQPVDKSYKGIKVSKSGKKFL
jgi:hypothetical protein